MAGVSSAQHVRPLAGSPGGHKVGHNFEPTQADPVHWRRDARHTCPVQAGCSRFQPQAPKHLKSLGSASSPWVQIPLPPRSLPASAELPSNRVLASRRAGPGGTAFRGRCPHTAEPMVELGAASVRQSATVHLKSGAAAPVLSGARGGWLGFPTPRARRLGAL